MWLLEKYATHDMGSSWRTTKKEQGSLSLQLINNQLLIVHNAVVIETMTIPIGGKQIRGNSKNAIMAIIDERTANTRRLRFKFLSDESGPGKEHCLDCTKHLQRLFPFKDPSTNPATSLLMETEDHFFVPQQRSIATASSSHSDDSPLEELLRRCILDESFPDIVEHVEAILCAKSTSLAN